MANAGKDIAALADATAVDPKSVQRRLDSLLHAHLVSQGTSRGRYQFHDMLREYAGELTMSPERQDERLASEERMLSFYLHTANNADLTIFPNRRLVPMVPLGTQNRLAFFSWPECQSRYCSSENSCAPPPVPRITPISRFSSMDKADGSMPES